MNNAFRQNFFAETRKKIFTFNERLLWKKIFNRLIDKNLYMLDENSQKSHLLSLLDFISLISSSQTF